MSPVTVRVGEQARRVVERSPRLVCWVAARRRGRNRTVVRPGVDLLIDGFPRSGNSYLTAAIKLANPELVVASHVHRAAHFARARSLAIPSVAVVRSPLDAVASLLVYEGGGDVAGRGRLLLDRWVRLYDAVAAYDGVRVAHFEDITSDVDAVVQRVACCMGTRLVGPAEAEIDDDDIRSWVLAEGRRRHGEGSVDRSSVPDPARRSRADAVSATLEHLMLTELGRRARQLHEQLRATA